MLVAKLGTGGSLTKTVHFVLDVEVPFELTGT